MPFSGSTVCPFTNRLPLLRRVLPMPNDRVSRMAIVAHALIWTLVLGLVPLPAPMAAQESTNKLVHVVTKREGEITRFFVQNLEPAEITATFDLKLVNL